jgi:EAL domain-containing protein (putative c-di-GMP-specific phosphodiesterase class I)
MNVSARERLEMQSHLRHALERGEFSLHYQPQINAVDGTLRGAEALLRWNSPALGQVSPDQFIPLAEENGLILPIGYWVLETACAEAARWPEHLRISVNVSARQFRDKALLEKISAALASSGIAAHRLELEVTESLLLENLDETAEMLQDLRSLCVHIALDDFGTGYSSLSYLRRFPFGILKIDRSFISDILADPQAASLCRAIVQMGHVLGLKVVAEGVETSDQLALLLDCGVDLIQGYYYSKPLPGEEFCRYQKQNAASQ